jgi:hypothetical protein
MALSVLKGKQRKVNKVCNGECNLGLSVMRHSPSWQQFSNLGPAITESHVRLENDTILCLRPRLFADVRVQVIVPPDKIHSQGTAVIAKKSFKSIRGNEKERGTYRSRHCFPIRPGRQLAIRDHFLAPCVLTRSITLASSSVVQGPFTSSGFSTYG